MTHFCALLITDIRYDIDELYEVLWPWSFDHPDTVMPISDYIKIVGLYENALDPYFDEKNPPPVSVSSQKQRKFLEIEALEARAVVQSASIYDKVHAAIGDHPLPDVDALRQVYGNRDWPDHFHADPAVQAACAAVPGLRIPEEISFLRHPRHEVLDLARRRALLTLGLFVDGQWHAFEKLDLYENPVKTESWEIFFKQHLASARPESWLTVVDCHW